jgi:hypothetical protein
MNEILQTLGNAIRDSGWFAAALLSILVAPLLLKIVQEVLKARVQLAEIRRRGNANLPAISEKRGVAQKTGRRAPSPAVTDADTVVNANFDILEKYYEQTLAENRMLSRSAIGVAVLGFFVILIGGSLAFIGYTPVGVVSSFAGVLSEGASLMFFSQLREQVRQVQDYHKKLVSTQYLMTSIALAKSLTGERHESEISTIIKNLLFLSNELHGSKSNHLFVLAQVDEATPPIPVSSAVGRLSAARATPAA